MKCLLIILLLMFLSHLSDARDTRLPWVVYYGNSATSEQFDPYNPIILNIDSLPSLEPLLQKDKELLGYINLTEAEERNPWFSQVKKEGLLIKENPHWKGSWYVDVRKSLWKELFLQTMAPALIRKGFTGFFLDQMDIAIALETENPKKYRGMISAAVDLVHSLKKAFPEMRIMLNRGYEILPKVGNSIDHVLAETLYTNYSFSTKKYFVRPKAEFEWQLSQLHSAQAKFPHLTLFSLDYWDPEDKKMYKKIYSEERGQCMRPYVSTILLNQIIPEPK